MHLFAFVANSIDFVNERMTKNDSCFDYRRTMKIKNCLDYERRKEIFRRQVVHSNLFRLLANTIKHSQMYKHDINSITRIMS